MNITLIEIKKYHDFCQFYFSLVEVQYGEFDRSLFCYWMDGNKAIINLFFLEFKIGY
jgi:hypothetical protein